MQAETSSINEHRNARAEDGLQNSAAWSSLCEGVLFPVGMLTAMVLALVLIAR
jgi:hypothetical protein